VLVLVPTTCNPWLERFVVVEGKRAVVAVVRGEKLASAMNTSNCNVYAIDAVEVILLFEVSIFVYFMKYMITVIIFW
jgi:hypothetical protein